MGKITTEHINIIRDYLLSFDEGVRNNILSTSNDTLLNYISIIENGFIKDEPIDKISLEIAHADLSDDLLKIRNEYFISLAQISIDGGSNSDLDKIKASKNQTFQRLLNDMSDAESFEKNISLSLKLHQRKEMKKRFQQLDEEDEFELSDNEIKAAITSVERESMKKRFAALDKPEENNKSIKLITRYAIAASLVGFLISVYYLNFFNKEALIDNTVVAKIEMPNLIDSTESNKPIIVYQGGSGFAKTRSIYDSITIQQNGLSKQIDTLQAMLENLELEDNKLADSIHFQIVRKIDSLQELLNTYTFNSSTKKAILNLPKVKVIESIISIDTSILSEFYINIEGQYYLINNTEAPLKLLRITDKKLIEKLKKIELLN